MTGTPSKWVRTLRLTWPLVKKRVQWDGPFWLSHLITSRCNCDCPYCLWAHRGNDELTTAEIVVLYHELRAHGFQINYVWGGEPLLRTDFPELMSWSHRLGFMTVVNSNGYFLEDLASQLGPNLDHCIVSLDHPSERHDEMRRCPGLYRRVIAGVERLRREHPSVRIILNFTLTTLNVGAVREMAELARELGVSLYVCPMEVGLLEQDRLPTPVTGFRPSPREEEEVARLLIDLKRRGYHINNSFTFLRTFIGGKQRFTCHAPRIIMTVDPNGDVVDCRRHGQPLGNVRRQTLDEVLKNPRWRQLLREGEQCNNCNNPDTIDLSYGWSLRPEPLLNALKVFSL